MNDKICIGIVRKQQGIKGEVKATILLDNPSDINKISGVFIENEDVFRKITRVFALSGDFGLKLDGIDSVEQAIKIKNKKLYALKEEVDSLIDSDRFYIEDLIGKKAVFENEEFVGIIDSVENYGANDIVFIKSHNKSNLCFANIGGIILKIDQDNDVVVLNQDEFKKVCVYDEVGDGENED